MQPPITIRDATLADATEAARVTAASICALCRADHDNATDLIAAWTANKTPGQMRRWIAQGPVRVLVAERARAILGVGAILDPDEVALMYVDPEARFSGVSTALLAAMEARLTAPVARLTSTATARPFYLARGWREAGPPRADWGLAGFPMEKRRTPAAPDGVSPAGAGR